MNKYLLMLVFFVLGCIASTSVGQENNFEQRKKVAEQVRKYRQKNLEYKQGAFPERTTNPRMPQGLYLKPTPQEYQYWRRHPNGIHPNFGYGRPRVGYRPMITWLPEGTVMGVRGYVTPDRRRVIIGGNFGFYGIQGVNTFNFRTGEYR